MLRNLILKILFILCSSLFVSGCQGEEVGKSFEGNDVNGNIVSLAITGYNYTDKHINQFTVNGNGGGNLFVSSPTSGGGGTVCCVKYIAGLATWKVKVRWQTGACTYNTRKDKAGNESFEIYNFYSEIFVDVDPKIPRYPKYIEVHFYPGKHVEVLLTEYSSGPKLQLDPMREVREKYRKCANDKRPEEE